MVHRKQYGDIGVSRVLVTGGSGFFGSHLVQELLSKKYEVRNLDILKPVTETADGGEFIKADLRVVEQVEKACIGVDFIIHNAAIIPVSRATKDMFRDINVGGTRNVLRAAVNNNVKKVIYISSSAVYGIPKETPITEATPFNPVCDYGRSKVEAESVCNDFRKEGLDVVILRPRTIMGRGRLGLFQILFNWIADSKNVYLIGNGKKLFQMLDMNDFLRACTISLTLDCRNEDFNLGASIYGTVRDDLRTLIDYAGTKSSIVSTPDKLVKAVLCIMDLVGMVPFTRWHYLTADKAFYFDSRKAKKLLGWEPSISNVDMFKDGFDWYLFNRDKIDGDFGVTHNKSLRQRFLKVLKALS